jgi:hypothetical protein
MLPFLFSEITFITSHSRHIMNYMKSVTASAKKNGCWTMPLPKGKEVNTAAKIADSFIPDTVSDYQKAILITDHIFSNFGHRSGAPSPSFLQLPSLDQYILAKQDSNQKLWCGIYTGMISLFAASKNIASRSIEMKIGNESHMVSEFYYSEANQWFLTDPTFGLLSLVDENEKLLDLQSFKKVLAEHKKVFALKRVQNTLQYVLLNGNETFLHDYYLPVQSLDFYYYHTSLQQAYATSEKIKRYFLPVSWYAIFSNEKRLNGIFYLRIFFLFIWFSSFLLLIRYKRKNSRLEKI